MTKRSIKRPVKRAAKVKVSDSSQINNVIVVSDLHCGCRLGLCPPTPVPLDDGGTYHASPIQLKVWNMWEAFWNEWVPTVCHNEPFAVVINGDAVDGVHHGSTTQVSQNLGDQSRIATMCLRPIVDRCEGRFYMVRGTEAHVGKSGVEEERLGEMLGAVADDEGRFSRYEMWLRVGNGGLAHFSHHIGTTGSSHFESSAVTKELTEMYCESGRNGYQPPDIVVRSHRHRYIKVELPTRNGMGISLVTPGWQLRTPFSYRVAGGRITTPQIGGVMIRRGDHDFYALHKVWDIGRSKEVCL